MRPLYKRLFISSALVIAVVAMGGIGLAMASGGDPFCSQSTESMGAEKARAHQEYCERLARWAAKPPGPKGGPPKGPSPTAEEMLKQMKANADYGVSQVPPPGWLKAYQVRNAWLGEDHIVYAGAVGSDHSVGMVALATRWTRPEPEQLGIFTTLAKDGALRVVSAAGAELTLASENGSTYTFDLKNRTLTRK